MNNFDYMEETRKRLDYEAQLKLLLDTAMKLVKENSFLPNADVTDEMVLGVIISQVAHWSGTGVVEAASYAFQIQDLYGEAKQERFKVKKVNNVMSPIGKESAKKRK